MSTYLQNQKQYNSAILNLESLTKQYDNTLIQYNQVQSDYLNNLQNSQSSVVTGQVSAQQQPALDLVTVPSNTFWGTTSISSSNVSSVEKCSALCSITPGCSGATYNVTNNNQNNCWLRSGDGEIITGTSNQYAIIPKDKNYLKTLEQLNIQLINLNNEIMKSLENNKNIFTEQDNERFAKYAVLKENYGKLENERMNILKQLMKYQTLEGKQKQGELTVTMNYYNYVLLLIIVFICLFILSRTAVILIGENISSSSTSNYSVLISIILSGFVIVLFYYFLFK